jgi:Uma2 family endonuclease
MRDMPMVATAKRWTLDELHRLPDDGNKYEIIFGELYVTPPPAEDHENILVRLSALLQPYVQEHRLGGIFRPRAVVRFQGSEAEPDLFVRVLRSRPATDWDDAPAPSLVVEVLSPTTRRRDLITKRDFYGKVGVRDYWIVDPESRDVRIVRPDREDVVTSTTVEWRPTGASARLVFPVSALFED